MANAPANGTWQTDVKLDGVMALGAPQQTTGPLWATTVYQFNIFSTAAKKSRSHSAATVRPEQASGASSGRWTPPIVKTAATRGQGVDELVEKLRAQRTWLDDTEAGQARLGERRGLEMRAFLRDSLADEAIRELGAEIEIAAERVARRETDPYTACEELVAKFRARG